ncbi:MAG: spherulation-specific family 4 protein [Acidimicrobiales bacterium]
MRSLTFTAALLTAALAVAVLGAPSAVSATPPAPEGIDVAVPAYAWPTDDYLQTLLDPVLTPQMPSVIVVNIGNGDGDVSAMDATADALRARTDSNGAAPKVIGYVHTGRATRPMAEVKARIDAWLAPRGGRVHYDGIFFDETTRDCGSAPGLTDYRDYYRALRSHVWSRLPGHEDLVVNNPGTAVGDCYLDGANRTADIFMTFEGDADTYAVLAGPGTNWAGYAGGNVFDENGYRVGTEYDADSFWHLVYDVPGDSYRGIIDTAFSRYAGNVGVTDDLMTGSVVNPFDDTPSHLADSIGYASQLPR